MKLVIANTEIRQDAEGRFSLNDLRRASGSEDKNQPSNFLRAEQTQKLIEAINRSSDSMNALSTRQGGKNQGSYGVKELVYAYANWISADFYLRMIRTFGEVATGKGRQFGEMKPFKAFNGHAGYEPRWNKSVLEFFAQQAKEAA